MNLRRALRDRQHARLLERARRGDGEAFRALYRALFAPVTGYLARRIAPREDVEDLSAQVFHRLLERLDRFDPARGSVMAWVLTIAHHALVDHVRRRRPEALGPAVDGAATPPSDDPLERLIRAERADAARALLARLAPDLRRMAELRYDMDLSHAEIAAVLEISEDAVKQRFSRMHRRLRVALAKEGGTHDV